MDRIEAMQVFLKVAEFSSFSKAADVLHLPRATVSNAIQHLEKRLGAQLFQRTTRRVSLTQEGLLYQERCTRLVAELEETDNLFTGAARSPSGVVQVDLPERMARLEIIPRLPRFFERYPEIQLRFGANDRFVDLVGEGVDCAVRVGELPDSTLMARRVGAMAQVNCASPAYLAQYGVPQTLADLEHHLAVNFHSSRLGRDLDWEYTHNGETRLIRMQSRISVTSSEAYMACCLAGLGLVQAPRNGIVPLLASGQLVEVLPRYRAAPLPVSVVYAQNRRLSARVRVFVDWVVDVLTGNMQTELPLVGVTDGADS
ncbi:LysR family transcriptional regulator [Silvimonas iriomotensis]|uniref:Transcriptional regulator n=1 Tax=Silvimonas iriomotensis TaxID=449662 RepID=A0ABQ2PDY1_9NEIS|nr:LysR family transcriptional regulator [Silvimonas iriomotensis]GGP23772.1 transcriptional regulator [Silvimonas iriomotensis]